MKALVYVGDQFICEAIKKPTYNRAKLEQTPADLENRELISKYVATVEGYAKKQKSSIEKVIVIDNTPARPKTFVMPGLAELQDMPTGVIRNRELEAELLPELNEEDEFNLVSVETPIKRSLKDRF
jgi:hypothetical protein